MAKGIGTCKVCGRDFALIAEEHYVARGTEEKGILPAFSGKDEAELFDAFDCPHCGSQNVMQVRRRSVAPCDCSSCEEGGCCTCKYANVSIRDEPCNNCKYSYSSQYERTNDKEDGDE